MLWCHKCKFEYDALDKDRCPNCGEPLEQIAPEEMEVKSTSWNVHPNTDAPQWPVDAAGAPEQAVFLTREVDFGSGGGVTVSMLQAFGIPVLRKYPGDGQLGKVVLGFSGYGSDLYVPQSMLELAKELLQPSEEEDM